MTGRDLIVYILKNGLEDKPVIEDGRLVGFMTVEEAANKLGFGIHTIHTLVDLGLVDSVSIGDAVYIPDNTDVAASLETARICLIRK